MKFVLKKMGLIARLSLAASVLLLSQQSLAAGTVAGTNVRNLAALNYQVNGLQFSGYTDLIGIDYRLGFAKHRVAGAHTSICHSYRSSSYDYGLGLDVGYNVRNNMWITLGYSIAGFHDEDFASARYTAQGPILRFSIKADQQTLKYIAGQR